MKYLRLVGGYFFRLTRKRSAVFLVITLLVILTVILQLYSKHDGNAFFAHPRVGNYDYRPGAFLESMQPENQSYCQFNYGLPDDLNFTEMKSHSSPEMGARSAYKAVYNIITGTAYANKTKYETVTYATQATPEFLYHIIEIARYWDGPISLSVFVPGYDFDLTIQIMTHLCRCYSGMSKVSMHIFYPQKAPPVLLQHEGIPQRTNEVYDKNKSSAELERKRMNAKTFGNKTRAEYITMITQNKIKRISNIHKQKPVKLHFEDCASPDLMNMLTFRKERRMVYPINIGRNIARNGSTSNYFLVSDIEMVPSDGLATKFVEMLGRLMGAKKREEGCIFSRSVFVVPLFEVERGEEIPRDKDTLVRLVAANRASYFHQKICSHCQRFPGLQSWLARPSPEGLEPMLIGKREYPYHRWEPLYFGTRKEPLYSEVLSWEGRQDKMTQMAELCLLEYRLLVLDGGFLCHAPARQAPRRARPERANARQYAAILKRLRARYGDRPQCKLDR